MTTMTRDELVTNLIAFRVGTASLRDVQRMAEAMLACRCREHETSEAQSAGSSEPPPAGEGATPGECRTLAAVDWGSDSAPLPISDADVQRESQHQRQVWDAAYAASRAIVDAVRNVPSEPAKSAPKRAWTEAEREAVHRAHMSWDSTSGYAQCLRDIESAWLAADAP